VRSLDNSFRASPDGERLRRFDLASGRALARSLAELRKHRHSKTVSCPLSVVSDPLSVVGATLEARDESGWLAAMHSPSLARRVGVGPDVSDVILSCEFPHGGSPNATNEPTATHEITTNEPTDAGKNETNERKQNGKPGNSPKGREARSGQTRKRKQPGGTRRNWTN
jgi:hypothetical protein